MTRRGGPLPDNFFVEPDRATRVLDGGAVVVGGSPVRLLRLTAGGQRLVARLLAGEPVPPTAGAQRLVRRLLDAGAVHPRPANGPFAASDVTVVIPCKDDAAVLAATLAALGPAGRVIVVDDGSTDAAAVATVAARTRSEVIRHEAPRGPGGARESGWRAATTPVVAFVDAGCIPNAGWLEALLVHFADPDVAAVAPRIRADATDGAPPTLLAYEEARSALDLGDRPGPARPRSWVPYVPTAALVVRRSALEAVGGFDESLRFAEDVDLVWRLGRDGWTTRYDPGVEVGHPIRGSWAAWLRQHFDYGTGAAPLAARHGRAVAPLAVSAWTAGVWGLALLGFRKTALVVAVGTSAALVPKLRTLEHPEIEAARLAGLGHLYAGRAVADAIRRPWWPFALAAALVSRRARRGLALVVVVPPLVDWWRDRPAVSVPKWLALRLADDVAYGAGVWAGSLRAGDAGALVPDLTDWPGRDAAVESATGARG